MTEQERIAKLIRQADIAEDAWEYDIVESITDKFAKGFIEAKISALNDSLNTNSEDFRWELLDAVSANIWGK